MRSLIIVIALFFGMFTTAHAQDAGTGGIDRALNGVQNLHDTVRGVMDAVEGKTSEDYNTDEYRRVYPNSYDGHQNRGYHYGEIKPGVPPGHQKCKHKNKKGKGHNKHCEAYEHHEHNDNDHHDGDHKGHDDHNEGHQDNSRWYKPWSWNDDVKNRHED